MIAYGQLAAAQGLTAPGGLVQITATGDPVRSPLPPLPVTPPAHVAVERVGEAGWVFHHPPPPKEPSGPRMTPRMVEVLQLAADRGGTCHQLAAELGVAVETVKTHFVRVYRLLGARDRAHAIAIAYRAGWLT